MFRISERMYKSKADNILSLSQQNVYYVITLRSMDMPSFMYRVLKIV